MRIYWTMPVAVMLLYLFSNSYADDTDNDCVNTPTKIVWGAGGSTNLTLCGYQNGDLNKSFVQITNIPRKTKDACLTIQYEPTDNVHPTTDTLTVAPNEGVTIGDSRGPTTLSIDNTDGAQTAILPIKTDSEKDGNYGFSVSGQSSSVNVNVKIDWQHDPSCGT